MTEQNIRGMFAQAEAEHAGAFRRFFQPKSAPDPPPNEDPYPDVSEGGFLPPDPDMPARKLREPSERELLAAILGELRKPPSKDMPVFRQHLQTMTDAGGEATFDAQNSIRHIIIPHAPRRLNVTIQGVFVATVVANQRLTIKWPVLFSRVTVAWDVGAADQQFTVILASEPIEISTAASFVSAV